MKRARQLNFSPLWRKKRRKKDEKKRGRPKKEDAGVSHLRREALASKYPVHATLKMRGDLPGLRRIDPYNVICAAFDRGKERPGRLPWGSFRLVHYSVQSDHLHLVVEANDRLALSRGIQGLSVRIAKGLNRLWGAGARSSPTATTTGSCARGGRCASVRPRRVVHGRGRGRCNRSRVGS